MSLCEVHAIKLDMFRCGRFKNIASIARTLEFFFAVMFLSRLISFSSAYFPATVEFCRFFSRRMCMVLVSHRFVFFLGNLIVITLFVKSSHSAGDDRCESSDDEEEYLIGQFVTPNVMASACDVVASEETASVEKHIAPTEIEVPLASGRRNPEPMRRRRTRSEDFGAKVTEKIQLQLRRSETEADLKSDRSGGKSTVGRRMNVEDLSNEEFQRKVEEFIVRQQMFLREESLCVPNRKSFSAQVMAL